MSNKFIKVACAGILSAAFLAACGGGGSSKNSSAPIDSSAPVAGQSIFGTAAVGAAISGGVVEAKCIEGSALATTATDGTFTLTSPGLLAPCMLEITFGSPSQKLHSIAAIAAGRTNITPITEMVSAKAFSQGALPILFAAIKNDELKKAVTALPVAGQQITTLLQYDLSLTIPTGFDSMNGPLQPPASGQAAGDSHDTLLENFKLQLVTTKQTIQNLVDKAVALPTGITEENNKAAYSNAILPINNIYARFKDARTIALGTPRLTLYGPLSNLQNIKREADALIVPKCLSGAKSLLTSGMLGVNNGFVDFLTNGSSSDPYFFFDLADVGLIGFEKDLGRQVLCDFSIL